MLSLLKGGFLSVTVELNISLLFIMFPTNCEMIMLSNSV